VKRILLGLLILLVLLVVVGSIYEALGRKNAQRTIRRPASSSMSAGARCTSIAAAPDRRRSFFESGLGTGGTTDWTLVHDEIAGFTRTCAYDRAGIMWSDAKDTPQDAAAVDRGPARAAEGRGNHLTRWCSSATRSAVPTRGPMSANMANRLPGW
jgi:transcription elongation factor